jgi:hypothetical protein
MNKCTRSILLDSPEKTLVVEGIWEYAGPQGITEHGDDSPGLFLECCILLFYCACGPMSVSKLLLQLHDPDSVCHILLFSGLKSLFEIVGSRGELFSVELAPALSGHGVQV